MPPGASFMNVGNMIIEIKISIFFNIIDYRFQRASVVERNSKEKQSFIIDRQRLIFKMYDKSIIEKLSDENTYLLE